MMSDTDTQMRCGFVALIGAPNAGKSTLLNQMVGSKVSIVTHKVQTTRARIRGIALHEKTQLVFVDTPGIFKPKRRLDRAMVEAAWGGASDADAVVLLVDAEWGIDEDVERILAGLKKSGRSAILAINKIDLVRHEALLALTAKLMEAFEFSDVFMISASKGHGVEDLRLKLASMMPLGPWHYPEDQIADIPLRSMAAEITREKLFLRLHQELPYSLTVETESWTAQKDGSVKIEQVIFLERESQKKIAIGKGGQTLKTVGQMAREEMTELFEQKVHLFLYVKVRENWGNDRERFREMGLDYPQD
ncbi:MAG: GTPase Era [Alphaproteobacteria bacterium]|nr:GTPase Era [Rhodobiaceae bacterium]MBO6542420.1 GTPase Era [Alphaproteobacteria bacterium]MBO6628962.1 GTPase Era [Alphaproteobacteria bacterium]